MAENGVERRKAGGGSAWPWMVLSIVLVAGFLAWLALSSEPSAVAVVDEDAEEDAGGAGVLALDVFSAGPEQYLGQEIRLGGVRVASVMGSHAFWTELPTGEVFLIRLDTTLVNQGFAVRSGDVLMVGGRVHAMSDSVIAAWEQQGAIQDEGQKAEAQFAREFFEATQARIRPAPGSGQ